MYLHQNTLERNNIVIRRRIMYFLFGLSLFTISQGEITSVDNFHEKGVKWTFSGFSRKGMFVFFHDHLTHGK